MALAECPFLYLVENQQFIKMLIHTEKKSRGVLNGQKTPGGAACDEHFIV